MRETRAQVGWYLPSNSFQVSEQEITEPDNIFAVV